MLIKDIKGSFAGGQIWVARLYDRHGIAKERIRLVESVTSGQINWRSWPTSPRGKERIRTFWPTRNDIHLPDNGFQFCWCTSARKLKPGLTYGQSRFHFRLASPTDAHRFVNDARLEHGTEAWLPFWLTELAGRV